MAVIFADDFRNGLDTGPDGRWVLRPAGDLPGGDVITRQADEGLVLDPTGTNPVTGEPCFAFGDRPNSGSDHIRSQAFPRDAVAAGGPPGFPVRPGRVLTGRARLAARTFGTATHPFGPGVVLDPNDDPRLATGGLFAADLSCSLVFLLVCTDRQVYAGCERIAGPAGGAVFCQVLPVAERVPGTVHDLALRHDAAAGTFSWEVDGDTVFRLARIGRRATDPRVRSLSDDGGWDADAEPGRLLFGLTTFTLLGVEGVRGEPPAVPGAHASAASCLWGQGTRLTVRSFAVGES